MNILDYAILLMFVYFMLSGWYRGFVNTLLSLGAYVISVGLALLFRPMLSGFVKGSEQIYTMALYYAEGSEFVYDVELSKTAVSELSSTQLSTVMEKANLPIPLTARITENIAKESFAASNVYTLGEYFNQTIVNVMINLLCVLILFVVIRLVLGFVIQLIDYARKGYPVLTGADGMIGAAFGLMRGFLAMYILFMLAPVALVLLPDLAQEYISGSFFGNFFYTSNFLLRLIAGT